MSKEIIPEKETSSYQPKDTAIIFGWIAALLLIAGIFWTLTQPVRNRQLVKNVNITLEQSGESRRLEEKFPGGGLSFFGMSAWLASDGGKFVIFSFIGEGTFFPCAALVNPGGNVEKYIPLNSHGERILERCPPEILKIYTRRIEGINL